MDYSNKNNMAKARVNITLELETNGARKKTELPMKLLVLGKFSGKGNEPNIAAREKININKENFNQVIRNIAPSTKFVVKNYINKGLEEMGVSLQFKHRKDFRPERVVMQVPELQYLLAMRNLLRELKANVMDNKLLRGQLDNIISSRGNIVKLQGELTQLERPTTRKIGLNDETEHA